MSDLRASILSDLKRLRKVANLRTANLDKLVGPLMAELSGRLPSEPPDRDALIDALTRCANQLPEELRPAVLAGFALSPQTRAIPRLEARLKAAGASTNHSLRTMQRRLEDGTGLLAEVIEKTLTARTTMNPGWRLKALRTVLRLDTALPRAHEERRIVATHDGLRRIRAWWDFPGTVGSRPRIECRMIYGGKSVRPTPSTGQRMEMWIELPEPLNRDDEHTVAVELHVLDPEGLRPHYVFTPEMPCDHFELRVRFHPDRLPTFVRRVQAEPVRVFDAAMPESGTREPVDDAGEIFQQFDDLTCYLGYGAQWWYPPG